MQRFYSKRLKVYNRVRIGMSIEIILPPLLQPLTGNIKKIVVSGKTVGGCLENLVREYPETRAKVFGKNGKLLNGISVYLNAESIAGEALAQPVKDGDKIYISFMVLGG
jgi:molybdopterin converting factor small subunit